MNILLFLIPLSLLCSTLGLLAFIWAVNSGQFDYLDRVAQSPNFIRASNGVPS